MSNANRARQDGCWSNLANCCGFRCRTPKIRKFLWRRKLLLSSGISNCKRRALTTVLRRSSTSRRMCWTPWFLRLFCSRSSRMRFATEQHRGWNRFWWRCVPGGQTANFISGSRTTAPGCLRDGTRRRAPELVFPIHVSGCGNFTATVTRSSRYRARSAEESGWTSLSHSVTLTSLKQLYWNQRTFMENIRALVVDDEKPALTRIVELLEKQPDVEIAGLARHGREAIQLIRSQSPDLLFLDIQMPGMSGFEVLSEIPPEQRPLTIFVTGYDKYAIPAFEAQAFDYLLKPFSDERFEAALQR